MRVDIAKDPELVELMKKTGCHTLFIGMESVNPKSLKSMEKKQTVDEIAQAIQILRQQRIHVHGMFVYGFDDDWHTVKETVRFAKQARSSSTQFMLLKVVDLFRSKKEVKIMIDYQEQVRLEDEAASVAM